MSGEPSLPGYVYLSPERVKYYADVTQQGRYDLLPSEAEWRERREYLQQRGYQLRKRYSKQWKPSWTGTNLSPHFCEDSIMLGKFNVIDATRILDNARVAIKVFPNHSQELSIARYLTSVHGADNHCVSALDDFPDPLDSQKSLMVMPYLRPFNNPEFQAVGDVVDFVHQMLRVRGEGLSFLHQHRIAHRDIAPPNVMMDATPLFPEGHHPVRMHRALDGIHDPVQLPRIDHPVQYFYIDFGLSVHFAEGASPYVIGAVGRDKEVPELSPCTPYNAFKADIYALGNLFDKEFKQRYSNADFLRPLVELMKKRDPGVRPPADELVRMFAQIRALIAEPALRSRLIPASEAPHERLINDTVDVARVGYSHLRRMFG
ncbi:hypothetical protein BD413DRAFT_165389 [Trametes elegans]|nr:hypothetical protein BD413DRAFT_165389 [Trametes elegans]